MDKDERTRAVVAEQIEKKREMVDTLRAVKSHEYAAAVQAGAMVINFINTFTTMANNGALHPAVLPTVPASTSSAQLGLAMLLTVITKGDQAQAEAMTADINALLGLAEDARAKLTPGVRP